MTNTTQFNGDGIAKFLNMSPIGVLSLPIDEEMVVVGAPFGGCKQTEESKRLISVAMKRAKMSKSHTGIRGNNLNNMKWITH
jgi:hypothetical protein